jgi:ABC-type transport system involved in cytochrome bd biosynthesis fused ATPase/permease subunit
MKDLPKEAPMQGTSPDIAAQARELSQLFLRMSMAVDQFRFEHSAELSPAMRSQLKDQAQHLDDLSDHYTATAIGATLKQIQDDLDEIRAATKDASQAILTIQKIEKVAAIVSAGVSLAAAIFAGNPASIEASVVALVTAVTSPTSTGV